MYKIIENPYKLKKSTIQALAEFVKKRSYNEVLFNALVDNLEVATELVAGYQSLTHAKLSFEKNRILYQTLIKHACCARKLGEGFARLSRGGIAYKANTYLYRALVNNSSQVDKLSRGFVTLFQGGLLFKNVRALYRAFILDPYYDEALTNGFVTLAKAGFSYKQYSVLYDMLLNNKEKSHDLAKGFIILSEAGIPFQGYAMVYEALAANASQVHRLSKEILDLLDKAGILLHRNNDIYLAVIANLYHADKIEQYIQALVDANMRYSENAALYYAVLLNLEETNKFTGILALYKQIGIAFPRSSYYFQEQFLFDNDDIVCDSLRKLLKAGYSYVTHQKLFEDLFFLIQNKSNNPKVFNVVEKLCFYARTNTLEKTKKNKMSAQFQAIDAIVHQEPEDIPLAYGPLNKSSGTKALEELLKIIATETVRLSFEGPDMYYLHLPNLRIVNLSLLLRNANLSQLTLSDELIEALATKFRENVLQDIQNVVDNLSDEHNEVVQLLPRGLRMVVALYIHTGYSYINLNRIFRSEELYKEYALHTDEDKNLLANFIASCLLSEAANKVNVLPWQYPGVHGLGIRNELLDRKEILNQETIDGRLANVSKFPALTSFSRFKAGVPGFITDDANAKTKLLVGHAFVVNDYLGEVIMPQGEQVLTKPGPGYFISTIVRSPTLAPKNHFWSEEALNEARQDFLLKEYKEEKSEMMLSGKMIVRPNHGAPHTYRVMIMIEYVAQYFAQYANDPAFKVFCQNITDDEIEWLRVGAAFSVTGRESETNALINLARYEAYREASANHFMHFVKKTRWDKKMGERVHHVIRYMGNPHYESAQFNKHASAQERRIRNYYHRLLSIAHKIDLVRCYGPDDYQNAMQGSLDLSLQSEAQKNTLNEIIRYDIALVIAHGDQLFTDMYYNGELCSAVQYYERKFARATLSLKDLFELTETVPRLCLNQKKSQAKARI